MKDRLVIKDAFKGFTLDQDKIIPPDETVRRFKNRLKQLHLDILKNTERIDNGRLGIPVYFSICGEDASSITGTKKQMGKGATPEQAEASAVMELAERFSFFSFSQNSDNFIIEKYNNLNNDDVISFDMIARSVHQSDDSDKARQVFADIPMRWTWGYNITHDKKILIPFDWFFAINAFNGPSAGNCLEEALIQGICEIVERHVSAIISQNRLNVTAIDPKSVTDNVIKDMIGKYEKAGIKLWLSDFSLDTGISTVGVLAYDPSTFPEKSEIVWTAGTATNPQKALSRALTETAQLGGDFNTGSCYVASGLPKFKKIEDAEIITSPKCIKNITELPDISNNNIRIEIENCVAALDRKEMEVFAVDITHQLLGIPAFYTIIPGAYFRERAKKGGVSMFSAKIAAENMPPMQAIQQLKIIDNILAKKYYVKFYIGTCYLSLNDPETALKYFTQALDLQPEKQDIPDIYSYIGLCLKDLGKYKQALEILEKGISLDSERTDLYNLMGFCYFKLKSHQQAVSCFKEVIRLNPSSAIDYANIAVNYRELGEKDKAIYYFHKALSIDPSIEFAAKGLEKMMNDE